MVSDPSTLEERLDDRNKRLAAVASALGNPVRLRLLGMLAQRPLHVDGLAALLGLPRGNTSAQLKALEHAGLVTSIPDGRRRIHQLSSEHVVDLLDALRAVTATVDPGLRALYAVDVREQAFDPERARQLSDELVRGERIAWDFRSPEEFAYARLPGAVHVSLEQLASGALDAPPKQVLVYCRGRFCLVADAAMRQSRDRGLEVESLAGDVRDWRRAGLPIEGEGR